MKKKIGICLIVSTLFSFQVFAQATENNVAEENVINNALEEVAQLNETGLYKPHLALMGGVSDPIENGYYVSDMMAIELGYQVMVPYGFGFEISTQEFKNDDKPTISQTQFFLKNSYHFAGETPVIKHSYIGLGLGLVYEDERETTVYGAIMPNVGFDIPLEGDYENLSLGANARYTASASNRVDNFNLSGVVKFWY